MFIIVYTPYDKRDTIAIREIDDYEKDEFALASRHTFEDEFHAVIYAKALAELHNLKYESNSTSKTDHHDYLD